MEVDVTQIIGATTRSVRNFEKDGKPAAAVVVTRVYDTSVEDLWEALTTKERIPRWFLPVEGELRLGGRYQLKGNAGGTVTACTPPSKSGSGHFAATWEFGGGVTWIDVTVTPESGRARMTLEHTAILEDHWDKFGPGAVGIGWDMGLMGLTRHLETGAAAEHQAFMAWMASANGRDFIRGSGEGWRAAHVASGEPPVKAKERSDRTIRFYLGEPEPGTQHPGAGS